MLYPLKLKIKLKPYNVWIKPVGTFTWFTKKNNNNNNKV